MKRGLGDEGTYQENSVFKFRETENGINPLLHPREMFNLLLNTKGETMPAKGTSSLISFLKKILTLCMSTDKLLLHKTLQQAKLGFGYPT